MYRIWLVGPPCSGKTTISKQLRSLTICKKYTFHELDQIYWKPNWARPLVTEFSEQIADISKGLAWVIDGYYPDVHTIIDERAIIIIKIQVPLTLLLIRLMKRSIRRIIKQEKVCGNNTENVKFLFSKSGLIIHTIRQYYFFKNDFHSQDEAKIHIVKNFCDVKRVLYAFHEGGHSYEG